MSRRADPPPSLQMVLSGGVGVAAVVVFVAALAFGADAEVPPPGARLGITRTAGPAGLAVVVPRCRSERVVRVEVRSADDVVRWRIVSRKGSIDERFVVGGIPAFGFTTEVPLVGALLAGSLVAVAEVRGEASDTVDRVSFDPAAVPPDGLLYQGGAIGESAFSAQAAAAADCQGSARRLGFVTWLFVLAASAVVVTYVMMVMRYWRGRHQPL